MDPNKAATNLNERLGRVLLDAGLVDRLQLKAARGHAESFSLNIADAVCALGFASEDSVARALAQSERIPFLVIGAKRIRAETLAALPAPWCEEHGVLPLSLPKGKIHVAVHDIFNLELIDEIRLRSGRTPVVALVTKTDLTHAIARNLRGESLPPPPAVTTRPTTERIEREMAAHIRRQNDIDAPRFTKAQSEKFQALLENQRLAQLIVQAVEELLVEKGLRPPVVIRRAPPRLPGSTTGG